MKKFLRGPGFYLILLIVVIIIVSRTAIGERYETIDYNTLLTEISENKVSNIRTIGNSVIGVRKGSDKLASFPDKYDFQANIPSREMFDEHVSRIEAKKLEISAEEITPNQYTFEWDPQPEPGTPLWVSFLPMIGVILFGVILWFVFMQQAQGGGNRMMSFGKSRARLYSGEKNKVTFDNVAGAKEEKDELKEIVEFLKEPKKFLNLGARIPKGVLLVGPPGTGKTLLAKAVAGEAGVPFFSISGSDFVEMFVGVGASRVRDLFENAKKNSPCILFIDEIDAVGRHRGAGLGGGHDEREQTLNQLLVEMDGFSVNEGIIILAATNRPDILDPALLRPGRFDRRVVVGVPDVQGREQILKVHSKDKPLEKDINLEVLAKRTPGFTGADLENLMNESAILAARKDKKEIGMEELEEAITRVIAGPEKKSRIMTDKDKKLVAFHEAGHAVVSKLLPNADPVHEVSIIPRGMAGGYTLTLPKQDKYFVSESEMIDEITQLLGGRVAEKLVLDDISNGASNDIQRATQIARKMVTEYGMSSKLGPITYGGKHDEIFLGRDFGTSKNYSEDVASKIDNEVRQIIIEGYNKAEELLNTNINKLNKVAEKLIEQEKLDVDEFEEVFENA